MTLTPEQATERLTKLNDERARIVQEANAKLGPLEAQAREIAEEKAVIIGNANLSVGRIEGEIKVLMELFPAKAQPPAPHLAAVPKTEGKPTPTKEQAS